MTGLSGSDSGLIVSDGIGRKAYSTDVSPVVSVSDGYAPYGSIGRSGDIAVDLDGNVWVSTDGELTVHCFDSSGTVTGSVPSSILPDADGLAFDDSGSLWVSASEGAVIYRLSSAPDGS